MKKELKAKNQQPATQQKQSQRRSVTIGFMESGSYDLQCTVVRIYDDNFKFTSDSSMVDVQRATEAFGPVLSSSSSSSTPHSTSSSSSLLRMDVEQPNRTMGEVSSSSSSSSHAQVEENVQQRERLRTAEDILLQLIFVIFGGHQNHKYIFRQLEERGTADKDK